MPTCYSSRIKKRKKNRKRKINERKGGIDTEREREKVLNKEGERKIDKKRTKVGIKRRESTKEKRDACNYALFNCLDMFIKLMQNKL